MARDEYVARVRARWCRPRRSGHSPLASHDATVAIGSRTLLVARYARPLDWLRVARRAPLDRLGADPEVCVRGGRPQAGTNKCLPLGVDRNLVAPRVLRKPCESSEKRDGAVNPEG